MSAQGVLVVSGFLGWLYAANTHFIVFSADLNLMLTLCGCVRVCYVPLCCRKHLVHMHISYKQPYTDYVLLHVRTRFLAFVPYLSILVRVTSTTSSKRPLSDRSSSSDGA